MEGEQAHQRDAQHDTNAVHSNEDLNQQRDRERVDETEQNEGQGALKCLSNGRQITVDASAIDDDFCDCTDDGKGPCCRSCSLFLWLWFAVHACALLYLYLYLCLCALRVWGSR